MVPKVYAITGSWRGKLFLSSRPRGGDWLEDEVSGWRRYGIDTVVSLLTDDEEQELGLRHEASEARKHDWPPISSIQDIKLSDLLETIQRDLEHGKNVLVHCRQGIGRTGLVAASLLVREGMEPASAIQKVSKVRGVQIPETPEQENCIYGVAANVK